MLAIRRRSAYSAPPGQLWDFNGTLFLTLGGKHEAGWRPGYRRAAWLDPMVEVMYYAEGSWIDERSARVA